jgi:hypothetical protein
MQLTHQPNKPGAIRLALAAASGALLATVPAHAQTSGGANGLRVDSALLVYSEAGGRVQAVEPMIAVKYADGNDRSYGLKLTLDSLTGASPNGAAPQPTAQTFTSPSGESRYRAGPNEIPLDKSFKDARFALALSHERPFGTDQRLSLGGNVSAEHDFRSVSANVGLARDYNQKNTTVSVGASFEFDSINPVGGVPQGMQPAGSGGSAASSKTRSVTDLLLGVTQVMNRRWITQLNLSAGRGSGYQSDPYKVVSVVDGTTGLLAGSQYLAENRPDNRTRRSLYWQNKVHLTEDVIDVAYRWYGDSWGVTAHTFDARYRWELGNRFYLEPHARYYRQSAADFWHGWLVNGADTNGSLAYASADPRLAKFSATTVGLKLGIPTSHNGEFSVRLEHYQQKLAQPANAPGYLATVRLMDDLKATTLMVGYSFDY